MNKTLRVVLLALLGLVVLVAAAGLYVSNLLSPEKLTALINSYGKSSPVVFSVKRAEFDFGDWLRLQPSLRLEEYAIANAPGFSQPVIVSGRQLAVRVALRPLFDRKIEVLDLRLDAPLIVLERNANGATNFDALLKQAGGGPGAPSVPTGGDASGSIDSVALNSLVIRNGIIRLHDRGGSALGDVTILSALELTASDLAAAKASKLELKANLFEGGRSNFAFTGQGGPYRASAVPVTGDLRLNLHPGSTNPEIRKRFYSEWLREPGDDCEINGTIQLSGDAAADLKGGGDVSFKGLHIGKQKGKTMPLAGTARFALLLKGLVKGAPVWTLSTSQASMSLGKGVWKGDLNASGAGPRLEVQSSGSVQNVPIDEFLSVFSPSSAGAIYGTLLMPNYRVSLAGDTPQSMEASLKGNARLEVGDGRIAAFDIVGNIQKAAGSVLGGGQKASDGTNFSRMSADLTIANRMLTIANTLITGPDMKITGGGTVSFEQALHLNFVAQLGGALGEGLGKLDRSGSGELNVPVAITGNASNPVVKPQVKTVLIDRGVGAATSILNQFLGGKKKKQ